MGRDRSNAMMTRVKPQTIHLRGGSSVDYRVRSIPRTILVTRDFNPLSREFLIACGIIVLT